MSCNIYMITGLSSSSHLQLTHDLVLISFQWNLSLSTHFAVLRFPGDDPENWRAVSTGCTCVAGWRRLTTFHNYSYFNSIKDHWQNLMVAVGCMTKLLHMHAPLDQSLGVIATPEIRTCAPINLSLFIGFWQWRSSTGII